MGGAKGMGKMMKGMGGMPGAHMPPGELPGSQGGGLPGLPGAGSPGGIPPELLQGLGKPKK